MADSIINIKGKNGEQLLFDAFCVLTMPEIKIEYNDLVKGKSEEGEEDDDQKQMPLCKLVKQVFTAVQKKEIIETIIPICCKLKKKLLAENKKLLPFLRKFIRELVKDYKSEINEIFKEDKQFAIEILHEIDKSTNSEVPEEDDNEAFILETADREMVDSEKSNVEILEKMVQSDKTSKISANSLSTRPEHLFEKKRDVQDRESDCEGQNAIEKIQNPSIVSRDPRPESPTLSQISSVQKQSGDQTLQNFVSSSKVEEGLQEEKHCLQRRSERGSASGLHTQKVVLQRDKKNSYECRKKSIDFERCILKVNGGLSSKYSRIEEKNASKIINEISVSENSKPRTDEFFKSSNSKDMEITPEEENVMKKAMDKIIIPSSANGSVKSKLLMSTKNICTRSPTTPLVGEKKELLTSTPLIRVDNLNFDMDISSVVDESS